MSLRFWDYAPRARHVRVAQMSQSFQEELLKDELAKTRKSEVEYPN
ncbi:hypothetical protein WKK05_14165 [Nostoc sp. UHCC 0302]